MLFPTFDGHGPAGGQRAAEEPVPFILHRAIPVTSVVGYARKKGNSLHRGYNPAMKNKRSDTPKVCWMQHGCGAEDVALRGNPHPARKTRERVLINPALHAGR